MKEYIKYIVIFLLLNSCVGFTRTNEYEGNCRYGKSYLDANYDGLCRCLENELNIYEKKLNKIYKYYSVKEKNKKLDEVELLWKEFKKKDCIFWESEVMGGHIYDAIYSACSIKKTKKRIKELQEQYLYDDCLQRANHNEALSCLEQKLKKYNNEVSNLYEALSTDEMQKAQRAWDFFREADCNYKASKASSKKKYKLIYNVCLVSRSKDRIQELNTSTLSVDWFQDADRQK